VLIRTRFDESVVKFSIFVDRERRHELWRTLFSQLMDIVSWPNFDPFDRPVTKYGGEVVGANFVELSNFERWHLRT
jgi:hypothetical protein